MKFRKRERQFSEMAFFFFKKIVTNRTDYNKDL